MTSSESRRLREPRIQAQRHRQKPLWPGGQLNEFLGRQAALQQLSTDEHRLEGAIPAPSETIGAEVAEQIVDRRSRPTVGFCRLAFTKPTAAAPLVPSIQSLIEPAGVLNYPSTRRSLRGWLTAAFDNLEISGRQGCF